MATINFIKENGNDVWKAAKQVTDPVSVQKMELNENGEMIKDDQKISNIICKFFKTKIEDIEKSIPVIDEDPIERLRENLKDRNLSFSLHEVTEIQVEKAIRSMKNKKSSGIDFVSPVIIKMAVDILKIPLWYIVNSSIVEGQFPDSWKCGKVTPI